MEAFRLFIRKNWLIFGLVFIMAFGAFLRWHSLAEWLHFEVDQARDIKVIVAAAEGNFGDLPLLGPRAGGTILRLGPGFYYLEYLSALLFGATPEGVTWLQSILSVATIGIFFVFARRFFGVGVSFGLTLLFAVSPFLVVYGRFAWNPNTLPFFLIGGFLSLLFALDEGRWRALWFILAAFLLGFATHLHFVAFVALPIIVAVFLIIRRPNFSWRVWFMALTAATLLYVPVAINEWATSGANAQQFLFAVSGKTNKEKHTLLENAVRMVSNSGELSWIMLSGYEWIHWPSWSAPTLNEASISCTEVCRQTAWMTILSVIILCGGSLILVFQLWRERDPKRVNALLLVLLWFGACLALFIPLSYDFSPRFFLLVAPLPFLALGFVLEFLKGFLRSRYAQIGFLVVIFAGFFMSDLWRVNQRFMAWATASHDPKENSFVYRLEQSDQIMQEKAHVTLEEQRAIVAWMASFQRKNGWPVYFFGEPEYRRALRYIMDYEAKLKGDVTQFSTNATYTEGNYFLVVRTNNNSLKKTIPYQAKALLVEEKSFGTLTVFRFEPRPETVAGERKPEEAPESDVITQPVPGEPVRYTWNEWKNLRSGEDESDDSAEADLEN